MISENQTKEKLGHNLPMVKKNPSRILVKDADADIPNQCTFIHVQRKIPLLTIGRMLIKIISIIVLCRTLRIVLIGTFSEEKLLGHLGFQCRTRISILSSWKAIAQ